MAPTRVRAFQAGGGFDVGAGRARRAFDRGGQPALGRSIWANFDFERTYKNLL